MKIKRLLIIALSIMLLTSGVFLTGCNNKASLIFGDNEPKVNYRYDETVYLAMEKARTLNPLVSKDMDVYQISKIVYNGLFEFDEELVPQPVLVSTYAYDDSGLKLNIQLKNGIKFSDGHELTGEDVKFSVETIQNAARYGEGIYGNYVSAIKSISVDKSDRNTLTIKFGTTNGAGIENLTFPIIPANQYKNVSDTRSASNAFSLIGTGPYTMTNHYELSSLSLGANPYYYGTKPTNKLVFQILPSREYAINMAQSGDITLFFDSALNKDNIKSKYDVSVSPYLKNEAVAVAYNCTSPYLSAAIVRKGISYAIDAASILEKSYYKNGVLTDSLYYPNYYGVENAGDICPLDLEKAAQLLSQRGFKDYNNDGILEDKDGKAFSLVILTNSDDVQRMKAAESVKTTLSKVGIVTEILAVDSATFNSKLAAKQYDISIVDITFDERYDMRQLLSGNNIFGFSSSKVNGLISDIENHSSFEDRKKLIGELKKELKKEMPYYSLLNMNDACYTNPYFDAEPSPMFNSHFRGCAGWRCKYPDNSDEN